MRLGTSRRDLRAEIEACGYFPALVEDAVTAAVGDEELLDFVVHHEPTFNHDELHRHVTVLALTPTRLVVGHTDDHPAEPPGGPADGAAVAGTLPSGRTFASSSTESIALRTVQTVALTRVVPSPEAYGRGRDQVEETWLAVGWGAVRRVDLEQASCGDPDCEADHGYTGTLVGDDLTVRMSVAIDGAERVARLSRFAGTLQRLAAG